MGEFCRCIRRGAPNGTHPVLGCKDGMHNEPYVQYSRADGTVVSELEPKLVRGDSLFVALAGCDCEAPKSAEVPNTMP